MTIENSEFRPSSTIVFIEGKRIKVKKLSPDDETVHPTNPLDQGEGESTKLLGSITFQGIQEPIVPMVSSTKSTLTPSGRRIRVKYRPSELEARPDQELVSSDAAF